MAEIVRNRTIRPSTRLNTSISYKVDTRRVRANDTLVVNISHETTRFNKTYRFSGKLIYPKQSIHFIVGAKNAIRWSGAQPTKQ